jgi:hypothetical protein
MEASLALATLVLREMAYSVFHANQAITAKRTELVFARRVLSVKPTPTIDRLQQPRAHLAKVEQLLHQRQEVPCVLC